MNYRTIQEKDIAKYVRGRNPKIDRFLLEDTWFMVNADKGLRPILVPAEVRNKKRWAEKRYRELFNGLADPH